MTNCFVVLSTQKPAYRMRKQASKTGSATPVAHVGDLTPDRLAAFDGKGNEHPQRKSARIVLQGRPCLAWPQRRTAYCGELRPSQSKWTESASAGESWSLRRRVSQRFLVSLIVISPHAVPSKVSQFNKERKEKMRMLRPDTDTSPSHIPRSHYMLATSSYSPRQDRSVRRRIREISLIGRSLMVDVGEGAV